MTVVDEVREACAWVAGRARCVAIAEGAIEPYAAGLAAGAGPPPLDPSAHLLEGTREQLCAFTLQLDAINFGSGWFPTLRKRPGRSGYFTVAMGLREHGPFGVQELLELDAATIAGVVGQDPGHELMELFAASLRDLGARVAAGGGTFAAVVDAAGGSALALVAGLATWDCFADVSAYDGRAVPFLKRAQIAAADLEACGAAAFGDRDRLTIFADNLVPHVLRLDGVIEFDAALVARIEAGELLEHGAPEEVEIRACALHAVELMVAARPELTPSEVDYVLWNRGQEPRYKARPRHRARCTAY